MTRLLLVALLASCVPSPAALRGPVDAEVARRIAIDPRVAVAVDTLLGKPLDTDGAIRIALATNERLAARVAELGIPGGELATATVIGPTQVDLGLRWGAGGHEYELAAVQDVSNLIAMPRRRAAAHADLAAARATAIATAIELAAHVELAMRAVLAAQQEQELRQTAFDAADAAATIRERQHDAGATTDLAQARERDAREQARLELGRAQAAVELRRARVDALLGLTGARTRWTATGRLPEPPATAPALDDLETAAVDASLALAGDRARIEAAANRAGAAGIRAVLPELGIGVSILDHRSDDGIDNGVAIGPAIRLGIPLFDQHQGERAKAAAELSAAQHLLAAEAVELRAHARAARIAALAAHQEVRHLVDVVLPLRQQIVDETLAHYNAMDADPFQLVAARRALADAGHDYLDALRRYHDAMTIATALRHGVALEEMP